MRVRGNSEQDTDMSDEEYMHLHTPPPDNEKCNVCVKCHKHMKHHAEEKHIFIKCKKCQNCSSHSHSHHSDKIIIDMPYFVLIISIIAFAVALYIYSCKDVDILQISNLSDTPSS